MQLLGVLTVVAVVLGALLVAHRMREWSQMGGIMLGTIAERLGDAAKALGQSASGDFAERLATAEADMKVLRRMVADLDESVEHRMKRIAARDRRALQDKPEEPAADDPAQLAIAGAGFNPRPHAANGQHHPTRPFGASNGRGFGAAR